MSLTKATNSIISGAPINVLDYGADPTGTNDSLAAFNAALAAGDQLVIPVGTYKLTATLTIPKNKIVTGLGVSGQAGIYGLPKLVFTAAVTTVAIDLEGTYNSLTQIVIDGAATTGIIGLRVGNVSLASVLFVDNITIQNFTGSGADGMRIVNEVTANFNNMYIVGCNQALNIGSTSASSFPTTLTFTDSTFQGSTGSGVVIREGYQTAFYNCVFQANGQAGVAFNTPSGGLINMTNFYNCWFEGNWSSAGATAYQNYHLDANNTTGGAEVNVTVDNCFFNGSSAATTCQAMRFNNVQYVRIRGPVTNNGSYTSVPIIVFSGSTSGWLDEYQYYPTYVSDSTSGGMTFFQNIVNEWTAWTPTYAAGGSMTFTSVTTTTARYKQNGKTLIFELNISGTTGGSAAALVTFTLPSGVTAKNSSYLVCFMNNNGTSTTGYARFNGTNTVGLYKVDTGNFTLGTTGFTGSFTIETV